jgi:serine/threonine-protein kinase
MPADALADSQVEIGHVLFIDIVGYSKRLVNEQTALVQRLNRIVRGSDQFRNADANGKLVTIPTGDGMALVFFTAPDAPVRCAIEINKADQEDPKIELRMGIHSGPVDRVADVTERTNVAGAGINMAQRVMDCGDSGHILLSQRAADDLAQYAGWRSDLHPLGEIEVKHSVRLNLFNFYSDTFGNPTVPTKLKQVEAERRAAEQAERKRGTKKKLIIAAAVALLVLGVFAGTYPFLVRRAEQVVRERGLEIPAKSVAVLPFENLSPDQGNAFLAGGIQDEIITQLSKIADLKVISRTSTMQYGSKPANLKQIAKELGVAALLEGSVQKIGNQIHVNVQLIKAATDAHLWGDSFTQELIDLLKTQSDIAQRVASELNTTLTTDEKARIEARITDNPEAYALYLKGTEALRSPASTTNLEKGQQFFEQAIALDAKFALAHARLAQIHTRTAIFYDPSALHKQRGLSEGKEALRLQPGLGEGHVALGLYYGRLAREYDLALKEYEAAKKTAPNDVQIVYGIAHIQMKQGQFRAAIANWELATSLDPMNWNMFDNLSNAYGAVRIVAAAERAARREMELVPAGSVDRFILELHWGWAYLELTGSFDKLNEVIARNRSVVDPSGAAAIGVYDACMAQRDFDGAQRAIDESPAAIFEIWTGPHATKNFFLGRIALARGDKEKARSLFQAELPIARSELTETPDSPHRHAQVGLICAYLGQKEEAMKEGTRAVELLPISKDAFDGPGLELILAEIYSRVGEEEKAVTLIEKLLTLPGGVSPLELKDCTWDPLRKNARFQKLISAPPPKIVYQ